MIEREKQAITTNEYLSDEEREARLTMVSGNGEFFQQVLDPKAHAQKIEEGHVRISYDAMIAAVMIHVYRDQPILQLPYRLLDSITTMDELMTSWRYRHAQMVMRMLGKKSGTGGSSGGNTGKICKHIQDGKTPLFLNHSKSLTFLCSLIFLSPLLFASTFISSE